MRCLATTPAPRMLAPSLPATRILLRVAKIATNLPSPRTLPRPRCCYRGDGPGGSWANRELEYNGDRVPLGCSQRLRKFAETFNFSIPEEGPTTEWTVVHGMTKGWGRFEPSLLHLSGRAVRLEWSPLVPGYFEHLGAGARARRDLPLPGGGPHGSARFRRRGSTG